MLLPIFQQPHIKKVLLVLALAFLLAPSIVLAQNVPGIVVPQTTPSVVRGLEISPFLLELDVAKGKTISSEVLLTNRSNTPLVVNIAPRDFLPGEEGQPQFVPDEEINDRTFSLSSWLDLKVSNKLTIQPEQSVTVPFGVNPPADAEEGTHYGALLFSYSGTDSDGSASEVQQSVGTILLVYYGQARENGQVDLSSNKRVFWDSDKVNFLSLFSNIGNVHVKPKGEVYIKNMFGQTVATAFINRDAANVLPRSERSFFSTWYPSNFIFGRYTAESVVSYGRSRLEARDTVVVWVLPKHYVALLIVIMAVLLWLIFHGRHLHKKRVIKKHLEKK